VAIERVKQVQTQYIKLGRDAQGAMKAIAVKPLALDMNSLATKTQIAAQKQQLFNQLMKQGSTQLLNFGKNTQWAGRQLMVGFTIPLTLLGTAASKAYMQIEQASIKFKRVYGDLNTTTTETNKMVKSVQALANEFTKYGLAVADTMDMAAQAAAMGKTGADLLQQIDQAAKLSVLGGVDQSQALATTISLTDAFKVSTDDLSKSIDFLNAVENQTALSIEDLTVAIPKAAPVVQQLGGDVKDLSFFLTAMKEGGINASEGANALKSGLASLINPSKKAAEFVGNLGININGIVESNKGDIKGTVIGFAKALDTLDPLNRARAIEQMFGKFQFSRLSTLFQNVIAEGSQAQTVASLANQTTEELAILSERELKRVSDSPMFKFQKSIQDMQAKLAPVGEAFLKAVTPIVEFVSKILDGFNNLSDGAKNFITILVTVVGGIGPVLLMTFGLIANGVANIMKLFTGMKSFINKTTKPSDLLGEQTQYMNSEQLRAAAIAASLDQAHAKLRQTFTSEAAAVQQLTDAYRNAVQAQQAFSGVPGVPVGNPNATPKKYANGVSMVPGPAGAGDIVPALLSPGEAVIPAKSAQKYAPVIRGMIAGNLPGFEDGTPGAGMRQSMIGPMTKEQIDGMARTGAKLKDISDEVAAGPYAQTPPTNYGTQISPTTGHSFPAFGVGGIYEKPDGTRVFVKPQIDLVSAMAEIRGTTIARDAHGLVSPEQALRVMMDPTDPENRRKFLVLESALDERIGNIPTSFSKEDYFKQLVASLLRGDKDLGVGNLGGNVLADVGPAGVFQRASGKRELGGKINSMEEQAIINLLGVKGGAKRFFAESTAEIAKSMKPGEYDAAMKAEIQAVIPKLQATIAGFGNLSPEEKKAYADMQQRLQAGMSVDWGKYQVMHSKVPPKKLAEGGFVGIENSQSFAQSLMSMSSDEIKKQLNINDTHLVTPIDLTKNPEVLGQIRDVLPGVTKEELRGFEPVSNLTAQLPANMNQKMKTQGYPAQTFASIWNGFIGKLSKSATIAGIDLPSSQVIEDELGTQIAAAGGNINDVKISEIIGDVLGKSSKVTDLKETKQKLYSLALKVAQLRSKPKQLSQTGNDSIHSIVLRMIKDGSARFNDNGTSITRTIGEGNVTRFGTWEFEGVGTGKEDGTIEDKEIRRRAQQAAYGPTGWATVGNWNAPMPTVNRKLVKPQDWSTVTNPANWNKMTAEQKIQYLSAIPGTNPTTLGFRKQDYEQGFGNNKGPASGWSYDSSKLKAGIKWRNSNQAMQMGYNEMAANGMIPPAGQKFFSALAAGKQVLKMAKGGMVPGYAEGTQSAGRTGKPKASVFDVDDTLLDLASFMPAHQERNKALPKEQRLNWWEEVAKNPKGIPAAIQRLKDAQMRGNKILLMTARPKAYDAVTLDTLQKLGIDTKGVKLISRENKDYRKPEQMKYDKTSKYMQWYDIEEFYDDMAKTRGAVSILGINAINPLKLAKGGVIPGYSGGTPGAVPAPQEALLSRLGQYRSQIVGSDTRSLTKYESVLKLHRDGQYTEAYKTAMDLFEYLASVDEKRVVHPGLQKSGLKMEQVYPDLYAYEDAIAAFKKGGGTEKVIEWEETLPIELAKGGIIPGYAKGTDKADKPKLKVINPAGVSRYLGIVKKITDNTMGQTIKDLGMTPGQEKYLWKLFMDNPEAAMPYLAKFTTRAAKPSFVGPGRGISKINQDEVLKIAREKGLKGADKATTGYGFSGKLGLDYRPTEDQLLKDLVNVILPNAQGQSKLEIQRLNQLRKLVKPYEKDPSKMPGGIKAALQDMFAIHRSQSKNQKAVPAGKVKSQFNMFADGPLEGPGLYTSATLKISDQKWSDYAGDNLYRQSYSPGAWNQLLKSKGYADDAAIINEIEKNPKLLEKYGYKIDKTYGPSVDLGGLKISDKLIQHLLKQGYVGYYGGATVKTNWRTGEKGFGLESFTPNMNSVLGYANGVFSVPGPKGAGDVVPAMLSPGEAVIPAKQAAKHRPMIQQMIAGNLPGYAKGGIIPGYEDGGIVQKFSIGGWAKKLGSKVDSVGEKLQSSSLWSKFADKMLGVDSTQEKTLKITQENLEEELSLSIKKYDRALQENKQLRAKVQLDEKDQKRLQENDEYIARKEQEYLEKNNMTVKKPKGLKSLITRNEFTGKATGMMYGASGLAGLLTQVPGDVGKGAQAALPAIGAMTSAMSMIPGPAGMVVGGLLAVATIAGQLDAHFKALREEAAKSVRALGASNEAMKGFAEFAKKVSSKEIMDKRREEATGSFFFIKPGKKTFGESFMESEKGKELTTATASALKSQDTKSAAALITSQMSTAIISGLLTPEEARSVVANLGKQIKNSSFAIDINSKITSFFGPDGKPLDFANNTIKVAMEAVVAVSDDRPTGTPNDSATSGGAVNEAMISAMNSIQAAQDSLALNKKATQEDKDALAETSKTSLLDIFNKIQFSNNKSNLNESAITAVEAAYKGSGLEERAKEVAQRVKNSDSLYDQSQEIFINQMIASKNLGVTQGLTATNLGIGGADLVELLQTNAAATNQLLSVAGTMSKEQGQLLVTSQKGKTSEEIASAASAVGLAQKTTGVYEMDDAQRQSILEYYISEEGLKKAQQLDKQFAALDKKKTITIETIMNASGNNTALTNALKGDNLVKFNKYFDKLKDKKNKLIYTTEFTSLINIPDAKLKPAIINYISEKYKDLKPKDMSDTEILKFKVEYAAYEANRVTDAGALQDLTVDPNADTGAEKQGPDPSILDPYVKMLREGANWQQKLTVGWDASYKAIMRYGKAAITQMSGVAALMKQYGADTGIINDFLGGTPEEQDRIIDKTTGKLRAGAGILIAKMKQIKDMQEFGLSYVLATAAERMAKDNELYQAGLDVIGNKEKKINDKYDKRIKALDEIGKLQDKNNQQQQDTLTLADALSKGDIAAAARAAMAAKQNNQKRALEEAKESIELARKQELATVTTTILGKTVTRADLESQIEVNSGKIAEHKRIELNRQVEIGKNALIAAKASAEQLANGKAIAGLPGANGSGPTTGGGTDPKKTPPGNNPPKNNPPAFSLTNFQSAEKAATVAGLTEAKGKAEAAVETAKTAITKKFKSVSLLELNTALKSGNYQEIYKNLKPAEQSEFVSMFKDLQTKETNVDKYTPQYGGDITSSKAGEEAKAAIKDTIPQAVKDAASLIITNGRTGQFGTWTADKQDYDNARRAYKDKLKSMGLEGVKWEKITPENQEKLKPQYDAYQAQEKEVRDKLKATNDARKTLIYFMKKLKVTGEANKVKFLNQYFGTAYDIFENDSLRPVDGTKDFMSWKHYAMGGMVAPKGYARGGGIYGTDTVPAMLTPGEFVMRKSAVDQIGSKKLNAMNRGNVGSDSVYNYSITVNANSSDASDIADAVLRQIKRVDSQRLRSNVL